MKEIYNKAKQMHKCIHTTILENLKKWSNAFTHLNVFEYKRIQRIANGILSIPFFIFEILRKG